MPHYEWDEAKRLANLDKHNIDFEDAWRVYEHPIRISWCTDYTGEPRYIDLAIVGGRLLALIYTMRGDAVRPISLRPAKRRERRIYEEGLKDR
jgi:uncharacterized protein